jgi:hypothetical protein
MPAIRDAWSAAFGGGVVRAIRGRTTPSSGAGHGVVLCTASEPAYAMTGCP